MAESIKQGTQVQLEGKLLVLWKGFGPRILVLVPELTEPFLQLYEIRLICSRQDDQSFVQHGYFPQQQGFGKILI
jgi:hypothetical protein